MIFQLMKLNRLLSTVLKFQTYVSLIAWDGNVLY